MHNIKILWDVIIDEDIIKKHPREFQENIFHLFNGGHTLLSWFK